MLDQLNKGWSSGIAVRNTIRTGSTGPNDHREKTGGTSRKTDLIKVLNDQNVKAEAPVIRIGDTVRVHIKIKEGAKERIQIFEGTVIAKKHGGVNETFTVRRISYGVGVEKVFPVHSPNVVQVETVRKGKVRRAKLYYLRGRVGKAAKVKTKL